MSGFAPIPEILDELRAGRMIVLVDDPHRENEGDVVCAAELVTPEHVNFMLKHARGEVCTTIPEAWAERMGLELQARVNPSKNTSRITCAKCVTVDASEGTTTGVSAQDQALTIRKLADPASQPDDFSRPGHTRPIRARDGGVLVRTGHTEGSVDLCRLAGLSAAAVICEVLDDDGRPMRLPGLREYCTQHYFKMTTIEELIRWRRSHESPVQRMATTRIPTGHAPGTVFDIHLFNNSVDTNQHVALTMGLDVPDDLSKPFAELADPVLVRVHSECLTGDVFGSLRCDCGSQLDAAMRIVAERGRGVVLYLRQEGRGIGLEKKLLAYRLQEHGMDTVDANLELGFRADEREYGIGAQILHHLGVRKMRLMTNNPKKLSSLSGFGLSIEEQVPLEIEATAESAGYLKTKRDRMGHLLTHL
ncbi:MAG: GTP cyclohydrolase II [Planctomycetes bacterium]|nr:GTP cyclohydrolase II [Planctomycetota bacterium]